MPVTISQPFSSQHLKAACCHHQHDSSLLRLTLVTWLRCLGQISLLESDSFAFLFLLYPLEGSHSAQPMLKMGELSPLFVDGYLEFFCGEEFASFLQFISSTSTYISLGSRILIVYFGLPIHFAAQVGHWEFLCWPRSQSWMGFCKTGPGGTVMSNEWGSCWEWAGDSFMAVGLGR